MSHEDAVTKLPKSFKVIAYTKEFKITIIENTKKKFMVYNSTLKLLIQIRAYKYLKISFLNL